MGVATPARRRAPAAARNRDPILAALKDVLPASGRVLEIAAGSGEHALWFSAALPHLTWQPSDPDPSALASIAAWREAEGSANLLAPIQIDACDRGRWPSEPLAAIVCVNMIHIAPWAAAEGLMALAGERLASGGVLFLYGPYLEPEVETAPSNTAFDLDLKARNPAWGLRDRRAVEALAKVHGLELERRTAMPANNIGLTFRKTLERSASGPTLSP
jgi:SAM-dependent methyltransferase